MTKTLMIAASAAMLATLAMAPAMASPKQVAEEKTVHLAPSQGIDIVEHGRHHKHFKFHSYGYGYSSCYWGWYHGKKVWVCY